DPLTGWPLLGVLRGEAGAPPLVRPEVVQPALWAVMVSLAGLWEDFGVVPAAVAGHSQGEIAAACVAGILTVPDAARIVAVRSKALAALAGTGAMAALPLPAGQAGELLAADGGAVTLAAVNGPRSVVISGPAAAVERVAAGVEGARIIDVDYASHSPSVEPIRDELLAALAGIEPAAGNVPFYSAVTGQIMDSRECDAAYWYRNLRQPVRFEQVTRALLADGHRVFIESSPHPVLTYPVEDTTTTTGTGAGAEARAEAAAAVTGTLRRDDGGPDRMLTAVATAWSHGASVNWRPAFPGARTTDLPTYPFQRKRYWLMPRVPAGQVGSTGHPVLPQATRLAGDKGAVLTGRISVGSHPWLADHVVAGTVLLPGTAFAEMAIRAGDEVNCDRVEELTLETPLPLSGEAAVVIQAEIGEADADGRRPVAIYSRPHEEPHEDDTQPWTRHASGVLTVGRPVPSALTPWPPTSAEAIDLAGLNERLAGGGYEFGPAFCGLRAAWRSGDEIFAEVALPADMDSDAAQFGLHPALLDNALRPVAVGGVLPELDGVACLPFEWRGISLYATGATALRVRLRAVSASGVEV
ncbi:MAG: acyltransferase domain-containing protein, partial [Nocardiopsaceae bacterium]|nr:acyltransferase domain-containing protein [Nocardiopsaceae bacterium]